MTERKCDSPFCLTERTSARLRLFEAPIFTLCCVAARMRYELRVWLSGERRQRSEVKKKKKKKRLHRTSRHVSYAFLRKTTSNNPFCSEGQRQFFRATNNNPQANAPSFWSCKRLVITGENAAQVTVCSWIWFEINHRMCRRLNIYLLHQKQNISK